MESKTFNFTQMLLLVRGLNLRGIHYILHPLYDGWQVVCEKGDWDAVIHSGSYGHEDGLLEVMGSIVRGHDDDVEGWLTAADILTRVDLKKKWGVE